MERNNHVSAEVKHSQIILSTFPLTMIRGEHHHSAFSQAQLIESGEQPPNLAVHVRHSGIIVLTDTPLDDMIQNAVIFQ